MSNSKRYIPTCKPVDWDIKELSKEKRQEIAERLVIGIGHSEEDYQLVISYLHEKYWDLMDKNPDGMNLQWRYSPRNDSQKTMVHNSKTGEDFNMYFFVYYDPERDMEPVIFGGSYFQLIKYNESYGDIPRFDYNGNLNPNGPFVQSGMGYVLFCDPDYRRMGLASNQWIQEAQLYRDCNIHYQRDIQNEHSLKVTQSIFDKPEHCLITSPGRLKNDGTRAGIRILMDYYDESLIKNFERLSDNMKEIYGPLRWNFLERENFTKEELLKPWKDK